MKPSICLSCLLMALCNLLLPVKSGAQAINNTSIERTIDAASFLRLNYENDFFTATDYYYTQGVHLELVTPGLGRFITRKILIHPEGYESKFGLDLQHNAYTPVDYVATDIQYGDRPFAGVAVLQFFSIANHIEHRQRISTARGHIGSLGGRQGDTNLYTRKYTQCSTSWLE